MDDKEGVLSPDDFAAAMKKIADRGRRDPEASHADADDLILRQLRALGYGATCDEFDRVEKWYA